MASKANNEYKISKNVNKILNSHYLLRDKLIHNKLNERVYLDTRNQYINTVEYSVLFVIPSTQCCTNIHINHISEYYTPLLILLQTDEVEDYRISCTNRDRVRDFVSLFVHSRLNVISPRKSSTR